LRTCVLAYLRSENFALSNPPLYRRYLFAFFFLFQIALNAQNYAGPDKYICFDTKQVQIGNIASSEDYCYQWMPETGLNNPKSQAPTATGIKTKTTYKIMVTDIDGMFIAEDEMTIFPYTISVNAYQPKVFTGNTTTAINPSDLLMKGIQLLVNLDNDNKNASFDKEDAANTQEDEMAKITIGINLMGAGNYPIPPIKVETVGAGLKLWQNENHTVAIGTGAFDYENPIWVEGITAHDAQKQAALKITFDLDKESANDCAKIIPVTVIGIKSMRWEGIGNGGPDAPFTNSADLDPNPNDPANGQRVFSDARYPAVTVPLDKVKLKVTLSAPAVYSLVMYAKSFDVDDNYKNSEGDAYNLLDPNDKGVAGTYSGTMLTYTAEEDNRANENKAGLFIIPVPDANKIVKVTFAADTDTQYFEQFQTSQFAGDNYRVACYGDRDFLLQIGNKDQNDGIDIADCCALAPGIAGAVHSTANNNAPSRSVKSIDLSLQSKVLSVWRLLHIEYDAMTGFTEDKNALEPYLHDFDGNKLTNGNKSTTLVTKVKNVMLPMGMKHENAYPNPPTDNLSDKSHDLDTPITFSGSSITIEKGRFENGKMKVGGNTINDIEANGINYFKFKTPKDLGNLPFLLFLTLTPLMSYFP
jgi:hypothetical protein